MIDGPRARRPMKVVGLVMGCWIAGRLLQAGITALVANSGLLTPEAAEWPGIVVAWGLLCVVAYALRERLDDWLRA
jgi:hypothetical protein